MDVKRSWCQIECTKKLKSSLKAVSWHGNTWRELRSVEFMYCCITHELLPINCTGRLPRSRLLCKHPFTAIMVHVHFHVLLSTFKKNNLCTVLRWFPRYQRFLHQHTQSESELYRQTFTGCSVMLVECFDIRNHGLLYRRSQHYKYGNTVWGPRYG